MKNKNQENVWDEIAPLWNEYKKERNTLIDEFLKDVKKDEKILDLGCGSGRNFIKTKGIIYAVDFSDEMLKLAKEKADKLGIKIETIKAGAEKLPFEDDFFEHCLAVAVFHCIAEKKNRKKALKELYRVMKPKSQAFVTVWDKSAERFRNKEKDMKVSWNVNGEKIFRYYYLYNYNEFKKELEELGFKIIKRFETRANIIVVAGK